MIESPLPKNRSRIDLHKHLAYDPVRNHIVDFLVTRGRTFRSTNPSHDPRAVPVISPGAEKNEEPGAALRFVANVQT